MSGPDPLAALAQVWTERWIDRGGFLVVDPDCNRVQVGMSMDAPEHHKAHSESQREWVDAYHTGRWRELQDFVEAVPDLRAALIHHVALHGHRYADGTTMMTGGR
ncbi:hypothetical protein SH584_04045 [Sphingomonas sp. LY29]|uniref:hypothetical protein n=1 Tax=Sphingomonas sp. LY29 TaxID=3095341 RepID=UPI002D788B21|nr:hypothetical protein [Sphingomonas sp. LY29]WRP26613.1 hypothetical protein SH584_04045 [Sphingomonas sp. LY29]